MGHSISRTPLRSISRARLKQAAPLMLMTYPLVILVILFSYVPLWGWIIAFIDYTPGVRVFESNFVGFKYFFRLFGVGSDFMLAMRNTIVLSLLILITTPLPLTIAILLNEVRNSAFKRTIQTVLSFPNFISWVIVYALFFSFFSVEEGLVNQFLRAFSIGGAPLNLLGDARYTWGFMTFVTWWKFAGWDAIIYMSAIASIDQELYQAAMVDGAGRFAQTRHITIPSVLPTFAVMFVLSVGNFLNLGFEQYFMFHNSLVHESIEVLDTYIYRIGMQRFNFSQATAVSMFKTVVGVSLLLISNGVFKKIRGYSLF